jgi:hypothetical protein
MVPARWLRCKALLFKTPQRYGLYTNVQAESSCGETRCSVYEQAWRQNALLIGNGVFHFRGRLTGFGRARNIVRIRTK